MEVKGKDTAAAREAAREAARKVAEETARKAAAAREAAMAQKQAASQPAAKDGMAGTGELANAWNDAADEATAKFQQIAAQLEREPDLKKYPPEALETFAMLRGAGSPELQRALDKVAAGVFNAPGFKVEDLKANPALAHLVGQSGDPKVQEKLQQKITEYAKQRLDGHLDGKEGEDGVKKATEAFQDDLVKLAEATGLGAQIQKAAEEAPKALEGKIEDTIDKGKNIFEKIGGAIGGFVSDVFGGIGHAIESAVGAVGDVAEGAFKVAGKVATAPLDLAAAGLNAVGLEGAAKVVDQVDDAVEGAYGFVGKQVNNFTDGAGAALGGTVTGVGAVIADPIGTVKGIAHLATHPEDLPKVGKALWDEATKGGAAYAIGYIAGNLAPTLLSGGSTAGASLSARVGAIAGKSRLVTTGLAVVKGSKVGQVASKVFQGARFVKNLPGKGLTLVSEHTIGKLVTKVGQQPAIRKIAERLGTSKPIEALKKVQAAIAKRKYDFNTKLDTALAKGVQNLDGTAIARTLESKLASRVDDLAAKGLQLESKVARTITYQDLKKYDDELEALIQKDPTGALVRERHAQFFEGGGVSQEKLDEFINEWTSTVARDPFQVQVRADINHVKPLLPKPGEAVDPKVLEGLTEQQRLIFDTLSTRRDRWARVAEDLGAPFPEKFDLYRGTSRTDKIDEVLKEWHDDSLSAVRTGNRQGGSWSIDPSNAREYAVGGPREFQYGGDRFTGVTYRAEVGFDDTFVDKFADGSGFAAKGPEIRGQREVVVISPDGSIKVPKENVKLYVGGKEYSYAQRAEALQAWQAIQNAASVNGWAAVAPWLAPAVQAQLDD